MALPLFQTSVKELSLMQTQWKSQLDPVLASPLTGPSILNGVVLASGANTINHKLGQTPQGWFITDINAAITVYRSQPFNPLTLTLTASGAATVNIVVY
jgi:hypothetical protein